MELKVGVIGMGNCGGQMADLASGAGFDAIAINASKDDMDTLVNKVECFLIGDGLGTGKSRDTAKEFMDEHSNIYKDERLIQFVTSHDVIMVTTSIGGGFGSGSSISIVDVLSRIYPEKLIIPTGVMPFSAEGYTAQNHSVEWIQELESMEVPYILYDNDKYTGSSEEAACDIVNNNFVDDLCVIRGDYIYDTKTGGIDPRDLMTTLSTPGRLVLGSILNIDDDDLVDKSLIKTIQKHITIRTAHADLVDDKQILASATMYHLPEEFDAYKGNVRADLQEIYGEHISDYSNFSNMTEGEDTVPSIAIILAGLTQPQTRIGKLVKRRDKLATSITERKAPESRVRGVNTRAMDSKLKLGVKSFGGTPQKKVNVDQILSQYNKTSPSED